MTIRHVVRMVATGLLGMVALAIAGLLLSDFPTQQLAEPQPAGVRILLVEIDDQVYEYDVKVLEGRARGHPVNFNQWHVSILNENRQAIDSFGIWDPRLALVHEEDGTTYVSRDSDTGYLFDVVFPLHEAEEALESQMIPREMQLRDQDLNLLVTVDLTAALNEYCSQRDVAQGDNFCSAAFPLEDLPPLPAVLGNINPDDPPTASTGADDVDLIDDEDVADCIPREQIRQVLPLQNEGTLVAVTEHLVGCGLPDPVLTCAEESLVAGDERLPEGVELQGREWSVSLRSGDSLGLAAAAPVARAGNTLTVGQGGSLAITQLPQRCLLTSITLYLRNLSALANREPRGRRVAGGGWSRALAAAQPVSQNVENEEVDVMLVSGSLADSIRAPRGDFYRLRLEALPLSRRAELIVNSGEVVVERIVINAPGDREPETPTPTPTATPTSTDPATETPSVTPTDTPTVTDTPSFTPTFTDTPTVTDIPSFTPTPTDTPTHTPTFTDTPTVTDTPSFTPTDTPTVTNTPTPTDTPTHTPTPTWTFTPEPLCVIVTDRLNVRRGPDTQGYNPPLGGAARGQAIVPLYRNEAASWIEGIVRASRLRGWLSASPQFMECNFPVRTLPVGTIPVPDTPTPTSTPTPMIECEPRPPTIEAGACSELVWGVENARGVTFQGRPVGNFDSRLVCPESSTQYTIDVTLFDGTSRVCEMPVYVAPAPTIFCTAQPSVITAGQCTTLSWNIENVSEIYLEGKGVTGSGSDRRCPEQSQTYSLQILLRNGEQTRCQMPVYVTPGAPPVADLVVTGLETIGGPDEQTYSGRDERILVPVRLSIANRGGASASNFKVAIEYASDREGPYVIPFDTGSGGFYPNISALGAGQTVRLNGYVSLPFRVNDQTITLTAEVDSCSGDEFMPVFCRVEESNEGNNTGSTRVKIRPFYIVD